MISYDEAKKIILSKHKSMTIVESLDYKDFYAFELYPKNGKAFINSAAFLVMKKDGRLGASIWIDLYERYGDGKIIETIRE